MCDNMKKIAVITSTRAEYGLLSPLIHKMMEEPSIDVHVLVSGTHLLYKYGHTIDYIRNEQVFISYEISIMDEDFSSSEPDAARATALALEKSAVIFAKEGYDAVIVLGDRYELLGFCSAAVICRIPIIHIHGGEITEGAIDDKIRHAITKLSSIHFPSVNEYADRIVQMGEDRSRVYTVGALGIDNAMHLELLNKGELFDELGIDSELPVAAVTYHPVTSKEPEQAIYEIKIVMEALLEKNLFCVITMPNSDVGGDGIYNVILEYTKQYPERMILKKSLGQIRYLSLLKWADIMVGNSSSGILESASFRLPTVDIGERQKGRMMPDNVIHTDCDKAAIESAIDICLSDDTRKTLSDYVNPYGDGNTAERMVSIIKEIDFKDTSLISKHFWNMDHVGS